MRRCIAVVALALGLPTLTGFAATSAGNPVDQRSAARAQIRLSDLPAGWKLERSSDDGGGSSTCLKGIAGVTATGKSRRQFAQGDYAGLTTSVGIFHSPADAKKAFLGAISDKAWTCIVTGLKKETKASNVHWRRLQVPPIGDSWSGRELALFYRQNGDEWAMGVNFLVAQKQRGVVIFIHYAALAPGVNAGEAVLTYPQEFSLLSRMVSRLPSTAQHSRR